MGSLGMPEILIILVIALIIFGPRKLPELGKTLGQSLAQFRRASEDFKRQWEDEVAIERQRLEAPPPVSAVEESQHSVAASTYVEETQSNSMHESPVPTTSEVPAIAHHEETTAQETKRDWM